MKTPQKIFSKNPSKTTHPLQHLIKNQKPLEIVSHKKHRYHIEDLLSLQNNLLIN